MQAIDNRFEVKSSKLKQYRESILMSRSELARKADVSILTITRIENGYSCRFSTMKKIIKALGLDIKDKDMVF